MGDKAEREIPKAGTALGPGGVEARDAKRRDEANEVNNIRRGGKLNRLLNRAIRNNDIGGAAEIKKLMTSFNYKDSAGSGGNIPDVDVMRNQARIDSDVKAKKRLELGQAQAAEDVAAQAQNAARKTDKTPPPGGVEPIGGVVPETQGQPSDGAAQPTNGNPLIPDNESDFERQDREARGRVFGEKKSAPNYALDARKAFAEDLDKSELIKQTDEAGVSAREKAYKRAKSLGISREKLQEQQGWQTDAETKEEEVELDALAANLTPKEYLEKKSKEDIPDADGVTPAMREKTSEKHRKARAEKGYIEDIGSIGDDYRDSVKESVARNASDQAIRDEAFNERRNEAEEAIFSSMERERDRLIAKETGLAKSKKRTATALKVNDLVESIAKSKAKPSGNEAFDFKYNRVSSETKAKVRNKMKSSDLSGLSDEEIESKASNIMDGITARETEFNRLLGGKEFSKSYSQEFIGDDPDSFNPFRKSEKNFRSKEPYQNLENQILGKGKKSRYFNRQAKDFVFGYDSNRAIDTLFAAAAKSKHDLSENKALMANPEFARRIKLLKRQKIDAMESDYINNSKGRMPQL